MCRNTSSHTIYSTRVDEHEPAQSVVTPTHNVDGGSTESTVATSTTQPGEVAEHAADSSENKPVELPENVLVAIWYDDVRISMTRQTRAPAVVWQSKRQIEDMLFTMAKKDGQVTFKQTSENLSIIEAGQRKL